MISRLALRVSQIFAQPLMVNLQSSKVFAAQMFGPTVRPLEKGGHAFPSSRLHDGFVGRINEIKNLMGLFVGFGNFTYDSPSGSILGEIWITVI